MAELYLVEFKGSRREYFYNTYYHSLNLDDYVIIQAEQGEHIGRLSKKVEAETDLSGRSKPRSLLRPAGTEDLQRFETLKVNEARYKEEIITLAAKHKLPMKIVDVECQFDGNKITFFFTADHRVDFRALVRDLAARYRTRIDLRQIGVRDEARRVGGFGICGREQCCNTFIQSFAPISTQHAREQDLTLNPSKISGNCGRLLCCLRYEVDMYSNCKKRFPKPGSFVKTAHGDGVLARVDIFTEEALIRNEENTQFRVNAKDIESVAIGRSRPPREAPIVPPATAEIDQEDVDALKKLDEPETD